MNNDMPIKDLHLSEEELDVMYEDAKSLLFDGYPSEVSNPVAILTGGQPGAGKSGIVLKSKKEFDKINKKPVILDGDTYRGLYPNSVVIAKNYPELYLDITNRATGKVMGRLIEYAIDEGYDFIREGTLNSAEIVDQLINSPRKHKIIIRLLAVSREESLMSCFERYILMKKNMGIGRFTTIEAHDKRFYQFPKTARIQADKGVEIEVYERGQDIAEPVMIYKSSCKENKYANFEEALNIGRENSLKQCVTNASKRLECIGRELQLLEQEDSKVFIELKRLRDIIDKILNKEENER